MRRIGRKKSADWSEAEIQHMDKNRLMEWTLSKDNLNAVYLQGVSSKGAAGVDGVTAYRFYR